MPTRRWGIIRGLVLTTSDEGAKEGGHRTKNKLRPKQRMAGLRIGSEQLINCHANT